MILINILNKIKAKGAVYLFERGDLPKDVFLFIFLILVAFGGYMLEQIISSENSRKSELRVVNAPYSVNYSQMLGFSVNATQEKIAESPNASPGEYVGAISGSTFYLPTCSGAKRIREENKIWFMSKTEAVERGYHPAANCKGI